MVARGLNIVKFSPAAGEMWGGVGFVHQRKTLPVGQMIGSDELTEGHFYKSSAKIVFMPIINTEKIYPNGDNSLLP